MRVGGKEEICQTTLELKHNGLAYISWHARTLFGQSLTLLGVFSVASKTLPDDESQAARRVPGRLNSAL